MVEWWWRCPWLQVVCAAEDVTVRKESLCSDQITFSIWLPKVVLAMTVQTFLVYDNVGSFEEYIQVFCRMSLNLDYLPDDSL